VIRHRPLLVCLLLITIIAAGCIVDLAPLAQPPTIKPTSETLQIHFIDVGQGDSILVISPEGKIALIDGGEAGSGALQYLQNMGVKRIDLMVATHPHDDHIGGLPEILESIPVTKVVMNGEEHTSSTFERLLDDIAGSKAEYAEVRRGDTLTLGSLNFEVLNPGLRLGDDINNNSIVLRLAYGKVSFLLMGDAEKTAEREILDANLAVAATVLKVGHHASTTSSSAGFLDRVRPAVAVYFAGVDNSFGHPDKETLNALKAVNAKTYGTDVLGTIVITSDGQGYQVNTTGPQTVAALALDIVSLTSRVAPGSQATLNAKTLPGARCMITVHTKSGVSEARGLEPHKADSSGNISWTWKVGAGTAEGTWKIEVTAEQNGQSLTKETSYTVKK